MPTARESRAALNLLTNDAVAASLEVFARLSGNPERRRAVLLDTIPALISYYADGSSALAADFYDEQRELAAVQTRYVSESVVADRTVKQRRAIAWASDPMFDSALALSTSVASRLAEVVQLEVARPFRDTITSNRRRDPSSVGWRRVTVGGCKFCRMLADRGAVYRQETARFAAHTSCHCTAEPVFTTNDTGVEASVMQYRASRRGRTQKQRDELRSYLETYYSDFPG